GSVDDPGHDNLKKKRGWFRPPVLLRGRRLADAVDITHTGIGQQLQTTSAENARNGEVQRAVLIHRQEPVRHRQVQLDEVPIVLVRNHTATSTSSVASRQFANGANGQRLASGQGVDVGALHERQDGLHGGGAVGSRCNVVVCLYRQQDGVCHFLFVGAQVDTLQSQVNVAH